MVQNNTVSVYFDFNKSTFPYLDLVCAVETETYWGNWRCVIPLWPQHLIVNITEGPNES